MKAFSAIFVILLVQAPSLAINQANRHLHSSSLDDFFES